MLLMSSLTASYAQIGDSITCYDNTELKRIASRVVYANECDSLLKLAEFQLTYKDSMILKLNRASELKDSALMECDNKSILYDTLVLEHEETIKSKDDIISEGVRKLKWTRFGWVATSAGLVALWLSGLF